MRQLFMLKEDYTNENTREIITRNGDKVYSINCFDDNGLSCYSVCNNKREEVVRVEKHVGTTFPCLDVIVDDKVSFTVEQSPSISSMTFNITSDDLEVFDDWWSMDFDIMSGYRKVSKVRNRWTALGDAYEMTIFEKTNEAQTVGLMLALDSMKKMEASVNVVK